LILVLDVLSDVRLHPLGVLWALAAAASLAVYFVLSDHGGGVAVHPVVLTTAGAGIGGLVLLIVSVLGLMPFAAPLRAAPLAGADVPWWVPLGTLILVSGVVAYLTGIVAIRRLGSSAASFVALTEVIFAVAFAALLLSQQPTPGQLLGVGLVLAGIAVVQRGLQRS
jgi:drug/metabolite transporter (DMT)-like permease